jgi:putative FmdB family regulatory protein
MPLYELECPECGKFEVYEQGCKSVDGRPCPKCGRHAPRIWKDGIGRLEPFTPYYTDAFAIKTVYVDSRKTEKRWLKEKGFLRVK